MQEFFGPVNAAQVQTELGLTYLEREIENKRTRIEEKERELAAVAEALRRWR